MSRTIAGRAQHATVPDNTTGGTCDLCGNAPTAPGTPLHDEDHEGIGVTTFYGFRESVMDRVQAMNHNAGPGTPYRVLNAALALIEEAADLVMTGDAAAMCPRCPECGGEIQASASLDMTLTKTGWEFAPTVGHYTVYCENDCKLDEGDGNSPAYIERGPEVYDGIEPPDLFAFMYGKTAERA